MAKESGIGATYTIDDSSGSGQDISNDVLSAQWTMPSNLLDAIGSDKTGMERLYGLADFSITLTVAFNDAANRAHAVFKNYRTLAANQVGRTTVIAHSGQSLTNEVKYSDYAATRGADGNLTFSVPGSLADGTLPAWT